MPAYTLLASQASVCPALLAIEDEGPVWSQRLALSFPARGTEMHWPLLFFGPCLALFGELLGSPSTWTPPEPFLADLCLFSLQGAQWQQHHKDQQE